jgi:hypothetical protein
MPHLLIYIRPWSDRTCQYIIRSLVTIVLPRFNDISFWARSAERYAFVRWITILFALRESWQCFADATVSTRCKFVRLHASTSEIEIKGEGTPRKLATATQPQFPLTVFSLSWTHVTEWSSAKWGNGKATSRQRSMSVFSQLRCCVVSYRQLFCNALQWFIGFLRRHERLTKLLILFLCG